MTVTIASCVRPRVMVSTISADSGGVPAMTRFALDVLLGMGAEPVLAFYEPYSVAPGLSVPTFALGRRRPGVSLRASYDGVETHAIGAWLPEFEFTTYRVNEHWQRVMQSCDAHVAVSGNILAALPMLQTGRHYLAWVATDWEGDRADRVRAFSVLRQWFDRIFTAPVVKPLEAKLIRGGKVLALSDYTGKRLAQIGGLKSSPEVCSAPINSMLFRPAPDKTVVAQIGFSGRIDDPRKNLRLLLEAFALLRQRRGGSVYRVVLIGGQMDTALQTDLVRLGVDAAVEVCPYLAKDQLATRLQSLDVFALPSYQEGLCIAALEAMACGIPVVSTRCGGPEEFVQPGVNGELVDFLPIQMADAIERIVCDRDCRDQYGRNARAMIEAKYTREYAEMILRDAVLGVFPTLKFSAEIQR